MTNLDPRLQKIGLGLLAPVLALVLAFLITSLVLVRAGDPGGEVRRRELHMGRLDVIARSDPGHEAGDLFQQLVGLGLHASMIHQENGFPRN